MAVDFDSGRIIHDINVINPVEIEKKNSMNTYATPSPAIEKGFVYVHYGSVGMRRSFRVSRLGGSWTT
jgi:hypothetical protein